MRPATFHSTIVLVFALFGGLAEALALLRARLADAIGNPRRG